MRGWWRKDPDAQDTLPADLAPPPEPVRVVITMPGASRPIERIFRVSDAGAFMRHVHDLRTQGKPLLIHSESAYLHVPAAVLQTCVVEVSRL